MLVPGAAKPSEIDALSPSGSGWRVSVPGQTKMHKKSGSPETRFRPGEDGPAVASRGRQEELERATGFEPATSCLGSRHSTCPVGQLRCQQVAKLVQLFVVEGSRYPLCCHFVPSFSHDDNQCLL